MNHFDLSEDQDQDEDEPGVALHDDLLLPPDQVPDDAEVVLPEVVPVVDLEGDLGHDHGFYLAPPDAVEHVIDQGVPEENVNMGRPRRPMPPLAPIRPMPGLDPLA